MDTKSPSLPIGQEGLGALLNLVCLEIKRGVEAEIAAKGLDLGYNQFLILKWLALVGPMMATELARLVELNASAITRQLDHLEARDLLRRFPHELDRRALRIELTDAGHGMWQELIDCNDHVLHAVQHALGYVESKRFHDDLTRLLSALRGKH